MLKLILGAGVQQRQLGDGTTLFSSEIAAIALPASLFEQVNGPSIGVFFGIYETATLLPISITSSSPTGSTTRQRQAISPVIAATVVENQSISLEDSENVTITFRLHNNTNNVVVLANLQTLSKVTN